MNLRPITLQILDNYKNINSKIIFNKGNEGFLSSTNDSGSVISFFELSEEEKKIKEHGIYDLNSLLGVMKELKDSDGFNLEYDEKFLVIKTKTSQIRYHYSPIDLLGKWPSKKNIEGKTIFSFVLKDSDVNKLKKMSLLMSMENIQIDIKENEKKEKIAIGIVKNIGNDTTNFFKLILGICTSADISNLSSFTWKINAWQMMSGVDYKVSMIEYKENYRISKFEAIDAEGKSIGLIYYIATTVE